MNGIEKDTREVQSLLFSLAVSVAVAHLLTIQINSKNILKFVPTKKKLPNLNQLKIYLYFT